MARPKRSNDWGFPRWRAYDGGGREARPQRLCDHVGCDLPGLCPAPKAPNRPERWWFCEKHAAEYNRGWDYFASLSEEERQAEEARDRAAGGHYEHAKHWGWGEGDGSRTRAELDALRLFDLPVDAGEQEIKAAYRRMAMESHPDRNPGNEEALERFQAIQAAYEILRRAREATADDKAGAQRAPRRHS